MGNKGLYNYSCTESDNISLGQAGYDALTSAATASTGPYIAVQVLYAECSINATSNDTDLWDTLTTIKVLPGNIIFGNWSSVQVTTYGTNATVICYRG